MDRDEGKGKKLLTVLERYKFVLLLVAAGAVLLTWPTGDDTSAGDKTGQIMGSESALYELETELEQILAKIHGVGRVEVMLTLQSGSELVLATDSTLRYSGSPQNPDDYDRSSETVTVSGGGGSDVVVTQERYPQYRGALIVCEGGDSDSVRLKVVEAVAALTGLGTDRIAVVRWGNSGAAANGSLNSGEELS